MKSSKYLFVVCVFALCVFGQNAGIQGEVRDQTGLAVTGVAITITNAATSVATKVETNERGLYSAPFLPPATYSVRAEKAGFSPVTKEGLKLDVQQLLRVDFALTVGTVSERIEVSATGAVLDTESTTMGQVIENKRIVEMPLNQRNYLELARLSAGVLPAATLGVGARTGQSESGVVAMGAHGYQTNILVDGVDNSSRGGGGALGYQAQAVKPSVDAVGEFKVVTNNFSAEYGYRVGPKILVSIKSGTNQLHASVFEFLRNEKLDGTNFFANRSGSKKPSLRQNQFGGTIGGPVIKDKTFFFFSYQGTRIRIGKSFLSTVPGPATRDGNFSQERINMNQIYDPLTTAGTGADAVRLPFAGNVVPRNRWDSVTTQLLGLFPMPNVAGREYAANNYFRAPSDQDDANQYDFKIDHNFTEVDRIFFRYSIRRQNVYNNSSLPTEAGGSGGQTVHLPGDNFAFNWAHSLSPMMHNEFRFGYTHFPTKFDTLLTEPLNAKYGIKNAPGDTFPDGIKQGFSVFNIADYATLGTPCCWPNFNAMDNAHFSDNILWQRGAHTLKAGIEYRRLDIFRQAMRQRRGGFTFNRVYTAQRPNVAASRTTTGNGLADLLLGMANSTVVGNPNGENLIVPYYGIYLQDDWKVSRKLTVNAGLRWEFFQSAYFPGGTLKEYPGVSNFWTEFQGVPASDARYHTFYKPENDHDCGCEQDYNNVAPRLGLAYQLTPKTVIRASGGIFFGEADNVNIDSGSWVPNTPEFTEVTTNGTNTDPATLVKNGLPLVQLPASAPVRGSGVITQVRERNNMYATQWFLDIQRQLAGDILLTLGYQGTKATHLPVARNLNHPGPHPLIPAAQRLLDPRWNAIELRAEPMGNGNYNALLLRAEKRFSKGLTFLASYTWSHNIENTTQFLDSNFSTYANPYDLRRERGNAALDHRQSLITSFTYELPFAKSGPKAFNTLVAGWQIGGILSLRTGFPFEVFYPGDPQNTGTINRGDRAGKGTLDNPTIDRWFDEMAFVQSTPGVFGNNGRNVLFGPGTRNFDLIAAKRFQIRERHSLQFRFEAFNFTNTPKFAQPNGNLRAAATATINQADEPRRIQFGLKYSF